MFDESVNNEESAGEGEEESSDADGRGFGMLKGEGDDQ